MGANSTRRRVEEIWASQGGGFGRCCFFYRHIGGSVCGRAKSTLDSEEGKSVRELSGLTETPSEDTKLALEYASQFANSSLEENCTLPFEKCKSRAESKFKNQCLILLRHLYLVKSKPFILVRVGDNEQIPTAPLETWGQVLG